MTAPALITLARGGDDIRARDSIHALLEVVAKMRPDLTVKAAFLDGGRSLDTVTAELASAGHREIVVVPLHIAEAWTDVDTQALAASVAEKHGVRIELSRPLGLEGALLSALDRRLRETLREERVRELDALVLAGAGSNDSRLNALVSRAARAWGKHHKLPTIAAFATAAPPAASEAVRAHRNDGRRHIAVGMLFLTPGELPDQVRELALEAGAVAVAQPIGPADEVAEIILARYVVGALDLVPLEAMFADL